MDIKCSSQALWREHGRSKQVEGEKKRTYDYNHSNAFVHLCNRKHTKSMKFLKETGSRVVGEGKKRDGVSEEAISSLGKSYKCHCGKTC